MQLQTCLTLITSLLLVGALNYHLSNMGTPSIIKSTDFNLRDYLQTSFLAGREFGQPELETDADFNNVLLLRLVKSPATRSGTRREHISRVNQTEPDPTSKFQHHILKPHRIQRYPMSRQDDEAVGINV